MAQQTDLAVRIATIFDESGLKRADKAVNKLQKSTTKLGRALGVSLSTVAIAAFGRAAVRAFNEDAKAAARLSNVVRNLGLSFEQANIDNFIAGLEKSASIADDSLRPAFQTLLTTFGSVTEAQKALQTAIEASRGSGYDLTTVAQDLSRAYTGNTKGLQKYYLGLTKAQLAAISFEEIQAKITKTFKGANDAYLNTAAGKMEAISIATGNYAETVGGALVDALITATGSNGVDGLVTKIDKLAQSTANSIKEFQKFAFITAYAFNLKNIFKGGDEFTRALNQFTAAQQMAGATAFNPQNNAVTGYKLDEKAAKEAKKQAELQAKLLKQSIAAEKALTAERKKQALLKKAGSIFDLEQIQIIAALKGNLSKEDELRLKAQLALLNGNEVVATSLTKQILMAQDQTGNLYKLFLALPDARNPFAYLEGYLDMLAGKAAAVFATQIPIMPPVTGSQGSQFGPGPYLPLPATNVQTGAFPRSQPGDFRRAEERSNLTGPMQVVVQIDGKAIASSLQNSSLSGIGSTVNRIDR